MKSTESPKYVHKPSSAKNVSMTTNIVPTERSDYHEESEQSVSTTTIQAERTEPETIDEAKSEGQPSRELSTIEILEKRNHEDAVRRARRAGVSTEGSTIDILERINHADVVKRAKRAGVSTEGTTSDIIDRITRKNLERMSY